LHWPSSGGVKKSFRKSERISGSQRQFISKKESADVYAFEQGYYSITEENMKILRSKGNKGIDSMNKLTNWIKSHQITAFFLITFAITWGLGFSYSAVLNKSMYLLFPLVVIATCGPALAGIIITAITNKRSRQGLHKAFWIAFFVAWVVSALVFIANITLINHTPLSPAIIGFSFITVVPVPFLISMAYSRNPAVRSYISSLIQLRGVWGWSLLALVLMPALILLSIPISSLLGRQPVSAPQFTNTDLTLLGLVVVKFLYQFFFFNATGEEVGWRGFILPRLQARTSPLIAALTISFFWAPWHFFLWQAEGSPVLTLQFWIERYASIILFSLIIVWTCNRTKGSILVAGITHAAGNTAAAFTPLQDMYGLYLTLLVAALVMILVDRMWQKLPSDHSAVWQGTP
jgi:membrane protease YdiL (CAAX protease family)